MDVAARLRALASLIDGSDPSQRTARILPKREIPADVYDMFRKAGLAVDSLAFIVSRDGGGYFIKGDFKTGFADYTVGIGPQAGGRYRVTITLNQKTVYDHPFRSLDAAVTALANMLKSMSAMVNKFTQ